MGETTGSPAAPLPMLTWTCVSAYISCVHTLRQHDQFLSPEATAVGRYTELFPPRSSLSETSSRMTLLPPRLLTLLFATLILTLISPVSSQSDPVRIMALGDSITGSPVSALPPPSSFPSFPDHHLRKPPMLNKRVNRAAGEPCSTGASRRQASPTPSSSARCRRRGAASPTTGPTRATAGSERPTSSRGGSCRTGWRRPGPTWS